MPRRAPVLTAAAAASLAAVLAVLRLSGVIGWPWLWVASPALLAILILAALVAVAAFAACRDMH